MQQSHIDPEALPQAEKPSGMEIKLCSGLPGDRDGKSEKLGRKAVAYWGFYGVKKKALLLLYSHFRLFEMI